MEVFVSSLIERLIIPAQFGGKAVPENMHVCDAAFVRYFTKLFGNLPPQAQPYLLRIMSVSRIVIDDAKFREMQIMAMKFSMMDHMGGKKFAQLSTRSLNSILSKISGEGKLGAGKRHHEMQKHHLVARSYARAKFLHQDHWINADFNISILQDDIHSAFHYVVQNSPLDDVEFFLNLFNQPQKVWTREAIAQARILAEIQSEAKRVYILDQNRKKAEEGKKQSAKK